MPPHPNPRRRNPAYAPMSVPDRTEPVMSKIAIPVTNALIDARRFGSVLSINSPQKGFDTSAGMEASVIMNAAVDREYPASVMKGMVCSSMTPMVRPNMPNASTSM